MTDLSTNRDHLGGIVAPPLVYHGHPQLASRVVDKLPCETRRFGNISRLPAYSGTVRRITL